VEKSPFKLVLLLLLPISAGPVTAQTAARPLQLATFSVDATPPIGSPLAYDPTRGVAHPLTCSGIALLGSDQPIVLCAIDWIGIANDGQTVFKQALATAAGTTPDRVVVHALHQHDAPVCDFSTDRLLAERKIETTISDAPFARQVIARAAAALHIAIQHPQPVTHLGLGQATVENVASNRRVLGPDGKVKHVRWSATKDPAVRAYPTGLIDPALKMITFWNGEQPLVALTYYATHPQSYYRTGLANPDFPGIARDQRQAATKFPHIHFDGAGGNVTAGKFNDGAPANRQILADRVALGMAKALAATTKTPVTAADVQWQSLPIALPPSPHLDESRLLAILDDPIKPVRVRATAATDLIWLRRCKSGDKIPITCLHLAKARVLHMPGELFVEYQLAAQKLRPDLFIAMAAYGDYAPGYIGTEIAYSQGGYETEPRVSLVAPSVEPVVNNALNRLLLSNP
jgi:hypothetical protein